MQTSAMIRSINIDISRDFAVVNVTFDGGEDAKAVITFDKDETMKTVVNASDCAMEEEVEATISAVMQVVMTHGV
jgi:uncharacterized protein (DUF2267 family)